jgi:3-isopropylmalate/(R)-2-methylmalate dehydratase small subunit
MYNCGMMAVELPAHVLDRLFAGYAGKDTRVEVNLEQHRFLISAGSERDEIPFEISEFDRALIEAGGWLGYADKRY